MRAAKRDTLMRFVAAILVAATAACSTPSARYDRQLAGPNELVVGQGVITRNDRIVASTANVGQLQDIVGCVDDARLFADSADGSLFAAKITKWVGYGLGLASVVTFVVGIVREDSTLIGVALGTSGVSAIVSEVPRFLIPLAFVDMVDAANAFNDQFETAPRCANQRPQKAQPKPPPAPPPTPIELPGGARF